MGLDNSTRDALRGRLFGILPVGQFLAANTGIPVVFAPAQFCVHQVPVIVV